MELVRTHGDGFLVAIQRNTVVGSVIAGWHGWRGNIYRLAVAPEARRRRLAQRRRVLGSFDRGQLAA